MTDDRMALAELLYAAGLFAGLIAAATPAPSL